MTDEATTELTVPPEIAKLGVEARSLYERVSNRLGLADAPVQIDRYELRRRLGAGSMGIVYLAWDPTLGREVAIKLVSAGPLTAGKKLHARLLREARVLAKLRHPNVVMVHDSGEHAGEVFLAMEYVRGRSLSEWQAAERSLTEIVRAYVEAGRGLAAAHASGFVHRDFKPDNVLVDDDDRIVVGDFGLASLIDAAAGVTREHGEAVSEAVSDELVGVTRTGELVGTPAYMAPEQLRGEATDARSDQFSFCVALWEAATGERPFLGSTGAALAAAMDGSPRGGGGLPRWLRRALEVGLSPRSEHRHADMNQLVAALERGLARPMRRRWTLAVTALGLTILTAVLWSVLHSQTCPITSDARQLRATTERLTEIDPHLRGRLDASLLGLERVAERVCDAQERAAQQHVEGWIATARVVLTAELPREADVERLIRWLEHARFDHPPPRPISQPVFEALIRARSAELADEYDAAIAAAADALAEAASDVDSAEAYLQRGQARSLAGDYAGAQADFAAARLAALRSGFVDAQLRARLLDARTSIMRLGDLERGREDLDDARALLEFLAEPHSSLRRADLAEYAAALAKREGRADEAAREQLEGVWIILLGGHGSDELASALTNLGSIEQGWRDDPTRARIAYMLALVVEPGFPYALLNLVHVLHEQSRDLTEGELAFVDGALERLTRAPSPDLAIRIHTEELKQAVRADDQRASKAADAALERALATEHGRTRVNVANAWRWLVVARAQRGELGASYRHALTRWLAAEGGDVLDRVEWELVGLDLALAFGRNPEDARGRVEQIIRELEALPGSERKHKLSSALADLHTRESAPQ